MQKGTGVHPVTSHGLKTNSVRDIPKRDALPHNGRQMSLTIGPRAGHTPSSMLLTSGAPRRAYDCYVVGSGPAGLTIALELAKASKSVLVFESGSADNPRTDVPTTLNLGHFAHGWWDHHSVRVLGGTSRVWAGWCATLTERDLNHPTGVRWPIDRATLVPYYRRAATLLDRDVSIVDLEAPLLSGFRYRPFSVAAPTRFGLKYRDVLEKSSAIDVALDCSVVGLAARGRSLFAEPRCSGSLAMSD